MMCEMAYNVLVLSHCALWYRPWHMGCNGLAMYCLISRDWTRNWSSACLYRYASRLTIVFSFLNKFLFELTIFSLYFISFLRCKEWLSREWLTDLYFIEGVYRGASPLSSLTPPPPPPAIHCIPPPFLERRLLCARKIFLFSLPCREYTGPECGFIFRSNLSC